PLVHETRVGERRALTLADGSEVILNTDTLIEVAFDAGARDLSLHRGEAYFSVASDAARPFRVHAGGAIVEAVGTAFTVQRTLNEELEVTVTEGEVNFMRLRAPEPEEEPDAPLEGAPLAASAEPIP